MLLVHELEAGAKLALRVFEGKRVILANSRHGVRCRENGKVLNFASFERSSLTPTVEDRGPDTC